VKSLLEVAKERVLVCDGAMGTQLQAAGMTGDECPEQWNVDKPDKVSDIHRRYCEAGTDLVITNTFGGNQLKLSKRGLGNRMEEFNTAGARLALEVVSNAYVLGDIGPTGELLAPLGSLAPEDAQRGFAEQAAALAKAGVHGIFVESMMSVDEAVLAVRGAREECDLPVLASITFQKGKGGYRTLMGDTVASAAELLKQAGAAIVGTNCGGGVDEAVEIITEMAQFTSLPLIAEPNAGVPSLEEGRTVFRETPDQWMQRVPKLVAIGTRIIGGCCGTTPEHIRRLRNLIDEKEKTQS